MTMLSIKKVKGSEGESEVLLNGKVVGHIQECDGGELDVSISSINNPFHFHYAGVATNIEHAYNLFARKAKDLYVRHLKMAEELEQLSEDAKKLSYYVSMKALSREIENYQNHVDNIKEFCHDEFKLLLDEEE